MKKSILILIMISLFVTGMSQTKLILNPITGDLEYSVNANYMADTLINLGEENFPSRYITGVIGHNNNMFSPFGYLFGLNSVMNCDNNTAIGAWINCLSDYATTIRGGYIGSVTSNPSGVNKISGSVGIGYFSKRACMYIHSGYSNGDPFTNQADIGGVLINRFLSGFSDSLIALDIYSSNIDGSSYMLRLKNSSGVEKLSINDNGNTTISGSFSASSLSDNYTPRIYSAPGDTSLIPVPGKVGNLFINTNLKDVFISITPYRGSWLKVN